MADDLELLQAWKDGDVQAGSQLFERHFQSICRFFASKIDRDVDDLVQKTFTACVEGKERFRGQSSFRTYVFAVARNILRSYLRTRKREQQRLDPATTSIHDLGLSPTVLIARRREQTLILQALRRIPLEHQTVLELYFWEEMSGRELGEVLGVPEGTVRGRIRRARQLLHERMAELAEDDALLASTESELEDWARSLREKIGRPDDEDAG